MTWYLIIMAVGSAILAMVSGVWVAIGLIKELTRKTVSQREMRREQ
jgi:hypothetical protein